MTIGRTILVVADACGVGEAPDAAQYGDLGAATVPHVAEAVGGLDMYTCGRLGLGNIVPVEGVPPAAPPRACFGKLAEKSAGKDSTSGHWEMAGVIVDKPFPVFPRGFPRELVQEFERRSGVGVIGNVATSGTEIIQKLGFAHLETKALILYTSADSVFQLAAHERLYPPERLYEICQIARELLQGEYGVGRVIARPFEGEPGNFRRTRNRRDFSLEPPHDTILDLFTNHNLRTVGIGKIGDLFAGRGLTDKVKTENNRDVAGALIQAVEETDYDLIFANFVDFDELHGHRNNAIGFARALEDFDLAMEEVVEEMRPDDMLIITADHGCDPTMTSSTDHTREYVPLLVYGRQLASGIDLGTRETFADIAATIADARGLPHQFPGRSFMKDITP
jgi:phosphopentomutase